MADIRHRVGIAVPPEEVYAALATVEGLSTWWTRDVDGDPSSGGKLSFRFGGPDTGAVMEVVAAEPERHVGWRCVAGPEEWLGTEITFDLTSSGAMTIILFTHAGWREAVELFHHCSTRWAYFLFSLKAQLEKGEGTPWPDDEKIDDWG